MKRKLVNGIAFVLLAAAPMALNAKQARTKVKNDVTVTVEKAADKVKGFRAFTVKAVNSSDGPRSLNMKIYLNKSRVKEPTGIRGSCTVFIPLPPGSSKSIVKQCKEKRPSNQWTFRIIKVYKFLLK